MQGKVIICLAYIHIHLKGGKRSTSRHFTVTQHTTPLATKPSNLYFMNRELCSYNAVCSVLTITFRTIEMFLSISGQHTCLTLLLFSGGAGLFRHCGALVVHHSLQVRQSYYIEQHLPTEIPCLAVSLLSGLALLGLGSLTLLGQISRKC